MFRIVGLWKYTPARDRSGRYESHRGLEMFWINSSFGNGQHQGSPGSPGLLHHPPSCSAGSSHPSLCLHLAELELGSHCRWAEQGTLTALSQTIWRVWPIRPQNSHHTHTGVWLKATEAGQSDFCGQEPLTSSVPKPPGVSPPTLWALLVVGNLRALGGFRQKEAVGAEWIMLEEQVGPYPQMKLFLTCKQLLTSVGVHLL